HESAVEDVAIPQPRNLTRANEPAYNAVRRQDGRVLLDQRELFHVKQRTTDLRDVREFGRHWFHVKRQAGSTTTRRRGSAPSDSETRPAAATASCTILRSYADIGFRDSFSPDSFTRATTSSAKAVRTSRREARKPDTSRMSRERSPVSRYTASRVSSWSASSTCP